MADSIVQGDTENNSSKNKIILELLEKTSVFIHLDPRREGVRVPVQFRKQDQLVLQVGLNMRIPIPDLETDDDGISCTLIFNGKPGYCWLPWESVFALIGEQGGGMVWSKDIPLEVRARNSSSAVDQAIGRKVQEQREQRKTETKARPPYLRLVK